MAKRRGKDRARVRGYDPAAGPPPELVDDQQAKQAACRHCRQVKTIKRRGLCRRCFYDPAVRPLYQSLDPRGRRYADAYRSAPLPEPTDAPPGSAAKIEVMRQRAALG